MKWSLEDLQTMGITTAIVETAWKLFKAQLSTNKSPTE